MKVSRSVAGLTVAAFVVSASPRAQQSTPQPIFRGGTDYVRVDVVVTDKNDTPITDLTKDDFVIEEHGRAQTIDAFQFMSVPLEHRTIDVTHPDPPADVATNLPRSEKSRLFVLVIDDLHILEADVIPVKRIMTEFIQALSPDDEVAVVFISHSNDSQNFTSDPVLLMKTVDRVKDSLGFGLDALGRSVPGKDNDPRYIQETARSADITLKNVVAALAGSGHARRAMVYVSAGSIVPTTPPAGDMTYTDFDDLKELYEQARRADVPIYALDPRGQAQPGDVIRGSVLSMGESHAISENIVRQQNRLAENAINTGGRAFTNQSNLTKAVDEIVAENGSYYLLGYYPNPFAADGKYHELTVRVNRPGAIVRARQGYVASNAAPEAADLNKSLDAAMSAGVNVSGVELRAFAAPVAAAGKNVSAIVTVEVTYPARAADARVLEEELRTSIVALDPDAKIKASSGRAFHFKGTAGDGPVTVVLEDTIDLPTQSLTLKIGVASGLLGKTGTIQIPIDVPKTSDKLQLGGIVIGIVDSTRRDPTMQAGASKTLVPFQPTTTRVFNAGETLRVFARAFWGSKDPAVSVTVDVTGGSTTPPQTMKLAGSRDHDGRSTGAADTTVSLAGLPPGTYQLEVNARLASGQTARRVVPFEIK
jgi:VWFA-related protein